MRSGSAPDAAPWIALVALGIAAAVLALIGLGDLPLRDFDEATVARVALELRHGLGELHCCQPSGTSPISTRHLVCTA